MCRMFAPCVKNVERKTTLTENVPILGSAQSVPTSTSAYHGILRYDKRMVLGDGDQQFYVE